MWRSRKLRLLVPALSLTFVCLLVLKSRLPSFACTTDTPVDTRLQVQNLHSSDALSARLSVIAAEFGSVCHSRKCLAALDSAMGRDERVPRIRHILWKSESVSAYFAAQLKTWADIHPDWTYVMRRDQDLEKLVAKHFAGVLTKFRTLKHHIMRVDMIRYLILYYFGGVYADLDYILVRPLDWFLKFPATVPITAEAIAMVYFGMNAWPPARLANPALMISEPKHPFFFFCLLQLAANPSQDVFEFAGPLGLSAMVRRYETDFSAAVSPSGIVLVPPSRAFDAFANNSFASSTTIHKKTWIAALSRLCQGVRASSTSAAPLRAYCSDVNNMDPITNSSDVSYAVHDTRKTRTSYDPLGSEHLSKNLVNVRSVLPKVLMAGDIF